MRSFWMLALGCVIASSVAGCNSSNNNNEVVQTIDMDLSANIKTDLEAIAKSGRLGSGTQTLIANIRGLTKKDPAKGEALKNAMDELIKLQGEAKIKAKAQEMLKLL